MIYRKRPNQQNQLRGAVNRAQGAYFEKLIGRSCEYYRTIGTAVIEKTPEPFHITGTLPQGRFIGNFAKSAQPDFKGTLKGGRTIVFEAKYSADGKIKQDRVTKDQAAALDTYDKAGALCFVFVSLKMQHFYFLPWPVWQTMKQRYGRKYMAAADMKAYEVRFNGNIIEFLKL